MLHPRMPFGKHAGKLLPDVPISYLAWMLRECTDLDPTFLSALRLEVESRTHGSERWRGTTATDDTDCRSVVDVRSKLQTWFREMSKRFHPDKTLDDGRAMIVVNVAHEHLQELFEANP